MEDDIALQKLLRDKLESAEIKTITAESGQQALNIVKDDRINLIVLDVMLPGGMNGFDVLEQLKSNPILKHIPVIVLTNLDTEQKTALEVGAIDYIVKTNISLDEVALKVKNHLQET